jgi:hypothetical protein
MVLSLYFLVSSLHEQFFMRDMAGAFAEWYFDFMRRWHSGRYLPTDEQNPELIRFERAADSLTSIRFRQEMLVRDFLMRFPNLEPLNASAPFTPDQRRAIYRLGEGRCQWQETDGSICSIKLPWDNWHADHIIPREQNGPTVVSNGRILCPYRNQHRGNEDAGGVCPFKPQ